MSLENEKKIAKNVSRLLINNSNVENRPDNLNSLNSIKIYFNTLIKIVDISIQATNFSKIFVIEAKI